MAIVASVQNLSKIYQKPGTNVEVHALRSINLDFIEGEYTAIMGGPVMVESLEPRQLLSVSISTVTGAAEEQGQVHARYAIDRTGGSGTATVYYSIGYGTASGSDFDCVTSSAVYLPGTSTIYLDVVPTDDTAVEDTEGFTVSLTSCIGDSLATTQATGTIADNDVSLDISGPIITAGDTETFTITSLGYGGVGRSKVVTLSGFDTSLIDPETSPLTTDASGTATVVIDGLLEGTSALVLSAPGTAQANKQVQVKNPVISMEAVKTVIGGYYTARLRLYKQDGMTEWSHQDMSASVPSGNGKASVDASAWIPPGGGNPQTADFGVMGVKVTGIAAGTTTLTITHIASGATKNVTITVVAPVITVSSPTVQANTNSSIIQVHVTNGDGQDMSGVAIDLSSDNGLVGFLHSSGETDVGIYYTDLIVGNTASVTYVNVVATATVAGVSGASPGVVTVNP